jgi:hypothetical protein
MAYCKALQVPDVTVQIDCAELYLLRASRDKGLPALRWSQYHSV